MAATIILNGKRREIGEISDADMRPGTVVKDRFGRNAYRILCFDHDDVIVRNARHPDLLRAFPEATFSDEFVRVMP